MTGRRLATSALLPSFWRGTTVPTFQASGMTEQEKVSLNNSVILSGTASKQSFSARAEIPSMADDLLTSHLHTLLPPQHWC